MHVAIIGGGWAGMAAAVQLSLNGHQPTVFEAGRQLGGRARNLELPGATLADNGQHILIGAYAECLRLMRAVGAAPEHALLRRPLAMRYAQGSGLSFPNLPAPLDALIGIAAASGWSLRERAALLGRALRWRVQGFRCAETATVADICSGLPGRLLDEFIEPLCVSALNLPAVQASGSIFLRVLHDALFAGTGGSHFLVPRSGLGDLFPIPAAQWLQGRGHAVHRASRIQELSPQGPQWLLRSANPALAPVLEQLRFDAVLLACPPQEAARLALLAAEDPRLPARDGVRYQHWAQSALALEHTAIGTVYARTRHRLAAELPWLALQPATQAPAQFVFDRGHLRPAEAAQQGLMAFVISDCRTDRLALEKQVLEQARQQLGWEDIQAVLTVVEKRATFACRPGVRRPGMELGHGLWACGDYVSGPYPATLEGAVRCGATAAEDLARMALG
ncbi:MAG: hydroxysqualene dehydroxylase HpnE [Comamonas sp.]|jgi:squalene-associated FAD-dependent desaturase|uniref:hydroxysqualene dehydroxylase HpnE n=1 Tax=Comamonas sp. TaxID=34028 RepID=UPI0012BF0A45|nr:hydroxysqualene dehydroxylase HpnE [Comamonas sp.]MDR3065130.1 hydroxysqualene dehydroxylase HpnE [Comamonas sp.]MPS92432.1 FAD-dependent oxidoreductase [Comamonas sp.]